MPAECISWVPATFLTVDLTKDAEEHLISDRLMFWPRSSPLFPSGSFFSPHDFTIPVQYAVQHHVHVQTSTPAAVSLVKITYVWKSYANQTLHITRCST